MKAIVIPLLFLSLVAFSQNLQVMEYFIDTDPGYGNAYQVSVEEATSAMASVQVNIESLSFGAHKMYYRFKDENGWGQTYWKPFFKQTAMPVYEPIQKAEFFVDEDPGYGNGELMTPVVLTKSDNTPLAIYNCVNIEALNSGMHRIFYRCKNANGWGHTYSKSFYKIDQPHWVKLCYTFNNSGQEVELNLGKISTRVEKLFALDIESLPTGDHQVHLWLESNTELKSREIVLSFTKEAGNKVAGNIASGLSLYPNPVQDVLEIETEQSVSEIYIIDMSGKSYLLPSAGDQKYDLSVFAPGKYVLLIHMNNDILVRSILKN